MKNKLLFTLIGVLFITNLKSQDWVSINSDFSDMVFLNDNIGFAVGSNGLFQKTTDGGVTWSNQSTGYTNTLTSIFPIDADHIYAVGIDSLIIYSENGGSSWTRQSGNIHTSLYDVYFVNPMVGFVCGAYNTLLKTIDGGLNWTPLNITITSNFKSIYFLNCDTGFVGSSGKIFKTIDGGNSWNVQFLGTNPNAIINDFLFINSQVGYLAADFGVMKTIDGGSNWTLLNTTTLNAKKIYFPESSVGYICGSKIYKSIDGGDTWNQMSLDSTETIYAMGFPSSTPFYAVGSTGSSFYSSDNGNSWHFITKNVKGDFNDIFQLNENSLFVVGTYGSGDGTFSKSLDGGVTWYSKIFDKQLFSVYFIDMNIGYIGGEEGAIYKTVDGGLTWSYYQYTNVGIPPINNIYFKDSNHGFLTGTFGHLARTNDGGSSWIPIITNTNKNLNEIYFTSNNIGFVAGDGGLLLKTVDGGLNWLPVTLNSSLSCISIHFSDLTHGFITGGANLRTTDGGLTWTNVANFFPLYTVPSSVYMIDQNIGYITTWGTLPTKGRIYKTIDGGITWTEQLFIGSYFKKLSFYNNTGYAVGSGNLIFKNTNGGGQIGINNFTNISQIKIYPNPATSTIHVECPMNGVQIEVSIFTVSGIELAKYQLTDSIQSLNISNLPSGLYIVRTDDGVNRTIGKFVKN